MADDGRAKRLKSSEDVVVTTEVLGLRRRIAELESENENLFRRGRQEGNHEILPVVTEVVVTTAVDLSRVDSSIVAHISSFLGTARGLLSLALTCKSFGWRRMMSTVNLSLVEEIARQAVCSSATDAELSCLPQYVDGVTTWLSILQKHEHLLLFDILLGAYIEHQHGDLTTVYGAGEDDVYYFNSVAVSSGYVMRSGAHYAEFQITAAPGIGIVRPMPGLEDEWLASYKNDFCFINMSDLYPDFLAQRASGWDGSNVHVCQYNTNSGFMEWANWVEERSLSCRWEGMERCMDGDTVGMPLNLDEGTLTVYKNNSRLGVMKNGLSGPYCWYAQVEEDGDVVTIRRGEAPRTTALREN